MTDRKHPSLVNHYQVANPAAAPPPTPRKAPPPTPRAAAVATPRVATATKPDVKKPETKAKAPEAKVPAEPPVDPNSTLALFGKPKEIFSKTVMADKYKESEEALTAYLRSYFANVSDPIGFAVHMPGRHPKIIKPMELSHYVGGKTDKLYRVGADGKPHPTVPSKIIGGFEFVTTQVDPTKPPIYAEKGETFINLFGGWLHPHLKGAAAIPTAAEAKLIEPYLNHIREVWCRGDDALYAFVVDWFARIAQMGKNQIGLYLKGPQGLGKSIIFDLMRELVFGANVALSTDRAQLIVGDFNIALLGKAMLVLEEMPTATNGMFHELTNRLKMICTGSTIQTMRKHADETTARNTISVAVLSNRDALALETGDRRWAELDLSDHRKGDMKYFQTIGFSSLTEEKKKALGLAMWKYLLCVDLKGRLGNVAPPTRAKAAHTMPIVAAFIKETVLSKPNRPDLAKQSFADFYTAFVAWHKDTNPKAYKIPDKKAVSQQLKAIVCIGETKQMRINGSTGLIGINGAKRGALILEYEAKMWIDHAVDDIEEVDADGNPLVAVDDDDDDEPPTPVAKPLYVAKPKFVPRPRPPLPTPADMHA